MTPEVVSEWMRCMAYTTRGLRCKRRMVCGKYQPTRRVLCAQHAREAGWSVWLWGR